MDKVTKVFIVDTHMFIFVPLTIIVGVKFSHLSVYRTSTFLELLWELSDFCYLKIAINKVSFMISYKLERKTGAFFLYKTV